MLKSLSLEALLLRFLDWVATPWVSLICRQWRQIILSTAHLYLAADVAGRAVSLGWWTFRPHLCFHLGSLCTPQSKPVLLRSSDEKHRTKHQDSHSSLFKRVDIRLFVFCRYWFCAVAERVCHCKVLLETSAHSQPDDALCSTQHGCCFVYSGATLTCLFSWWSVSHCLW